MVFTKDMAGEFKMTFEGIAKEDLDIEIIGGTVYAFGSELATLRLLKAYFNVKDGRVKQDYSTNMKTWFFRLEP